jgi:hypothetical protein
MDQGDVLAHGQLPQLQPGLALDAPKRAHRNVAIGMRNGDAARFHVMLELDMATLLRHPIPSIRLKRPDYGTAIHDV